MRFSFSAYALAVALILGAGGIASAQKGADGARGESIPWTEQEMRDANQNQMRFPSGWHCVGGKSGQGGDPDVGDGSGKAGGSAQCGQ